MLRLFTIVLAIYAAQIKYTLGDGEEVPMIELPTLEPLPLLEPIQILEEATTEEPLHIIEAVTIGTEAPEIELPEIKLITPPLSGRWGCTRWGNRCYRHCTASSKEWCFTAQRCSTNGDCQGLDKCVGISCLQPPIVRLPGIKCIESNMQCPA